MAHNLVRLLWAFRQLKTAVPQFHQNFKKHFQQFYVRLAGSNSSQDLWQLKEGLDRDLLYNWTTPIINDFRVMMTNGRAVRSMQKAGIADGEEFLSRYLSGDADIESTQPVKAMQALADEARKQPPLQKLIVAGGKAVHTEIGNRFPLFGAAVDGFIEAYGDRTVGELKLETRTMRLHPEVFYRYLKNYLSAEAPVATGTPTLLHESAVAELVAKLRKKNAGRRRSVWKKLYQLQQAIRYRESLRLERTRLFGMYRGLYTALGSNFQAGGFLEIREDIFYLTEGEIAEAVTAPDRNQLKALVALRRQEAESYKAEEVPSRVVVPSPPVAPPALVVNEHQLQGAGCVPGTASGAVIVIRDPEDALDVQGKIVCALRTDPGWAVLFPTCKAVLIEKGSSLSHSVILLRELGIPTIINIPGLTHRLKTGDTVHLDGRTGTVNIL